MAVAKRGVALQRERVEQIVDKLLSVAVRELRSVQLVTKRRLATVSSTTSMQLPASHHQVHHSSFN